MRWNPRSVHQPSRPSLGRLPHGRHRQVLAGLLGAALAVGLAACSTSTKEASAGPTQNRTGAPAAPFALPDPTGSHPIGTTELHLMDRSRSDPLRTSQHYRELMVQLWYPAATGDRGPVAPWMPAVAAAHFRKSTAEQLGVSTVPDVSQAVTHAHLGTPVESHPGGWPVVLFSPGGSVDRAMGTALVEELTSWGFVVVAIDHTYDAAEVEFPGGRLETMDSLTRQPGQPGQPADAEAAFTVAVQIRVADTRFVLDQLTALNRGDNPDAEHRHLPDGLRGALRLTSVGMFGHSLGGATAAQVMHDDPRVIAGTALDSAIFGTVRATGLTRPFLLMAAEGNSRASTPSWPPFLSHLRGWHREVRLAGAHHYTFTDATVILPKLAAISPIPSDVLVDSIGTIDGDRAITIERAYVKAFFAVHLDGGPTAADQRLLDAASPAYPEVTFGV